MEKVKIIYIILVVAYLIRFFGIFSYFPYDLHPDEFSLIKKFISMYASGDFNPHFFFSPALLIYLSAFLNIIISRIIAFMQQVPILNIDYELATLLLTIDRNISLLFSVLTIYYIYKIGKKIWNKKTGLIAATTLTFSLASIVNSFYLWFDTPVTFFIVLTFYYFIQLIDKPTTNNFIKIGISIGLAIATKYNAILLIPFYFIVLIFYLKLIKYKNKEIIIDNKKLINTILSLLITIIVFFAINPYIILAFDEFIPDFKYSLNQMRGDAEMPISSWTYYLEYALIPGLSIFGLTLLIISLFTVKKNKYVILILLWIISIYLINQGFNHKAPRYILSLFPFATLLIGKAIEQNKKLYPLLGGMIIVTIIFLIQLYPETRIQAYAWGVENFDNTTSIITCPYSVPYASGCNESVWWIENIPPSYIMISENYYERFYLSDNGQEYENYHFYEWILNNGTLIEEYDKLFKFGQHNNPKVSVYYIG